MSAKFQINFYIQNYEKFIDFQKKKNAFEMKEKKKKYKNKNEYEREKKEKKIINVK